MRIIDSLAALTRAMSQPLNFHLKRLLARRRDQLGDHLEGAARFLIVEPPDTLDDIEAALGFPLAIEGGPCWEWVQRHGGGWTEVVFVLSDEGPSDVLLLSEAPDLDRDLIDLLNRFAPEDHDPASPMSS